MMMMMMMTTTMRAATEVLLVVVVSRTLHTATDSMTCGTWPFVFYMTASHILSSAMQSDTYHIKSVFR
jgi:hypothetical protein